MFAFFFFFPTTWHWSETDGVSSHGEMDLPRKSETSTDQKKTNLSNVHAANSWLESDVKTLTSFRSWRFCFFSDWLPLKYNETFTVWRVQNAAGLLPAMAEGLAQQVEVKCLASGRLHWRKPKAGSDVWCYLSEGAVTSTFGWTSSCPILFLKKLFKLYKRHTRQIQISDLTSCSFMQRKGKFRYWSDLHVWVRWKVEPIGRDL